MSSGNALAGAFLFVSVCGGGGDAEIPYPQSIPLCDVDVDSGTAFAHDAEVRGTQLEVHYQYRGCSDDVVDVCWTGELDDRVDPPVATIYLDHLRIGNCDHDVYGLMSTDISEIRDAAVDEGHDSVMLDVDTVMIDWWYWYQ